jgi:hypothetical protein
MPMPDSLLGNDSGLLEKDGALVGIADGVDTGDCDCCGYADECPQFICSDGERASLKQATVTLNMPTDTWTYTFNSFYENTWERFGICTEVSACQTLKIYDLREIQHVLTVSGMSALTGTYPGVYFNEGGYSTSDCYAPIIIVPMDDVPVNVTLDYYERYVREITDFPAGCTIFPQQFNVTCQGSIGGYGFARATLNPSQLITSFCNTQGNFVPQITTGAPNSIAPRFNISAYLDSRPNNWPVGGDPTSGQPGCAVATLAPRTFPTCDPGNMFGIPYRGTLVGLNNPSGSNVQYHIPLYGQLFQTGTDCSSVTCDQGLPLNRSLMCSFSRLCNAFSLTGTGPGMDAFSCVATPQSWDRNYTGSCPFGTVIPVREFGSRTSSVSSTSIDGLSATVDVS